MPEPARTTTTFGRPGRDSPPDRPRWASRWLVAAAAYNILWGAWVILFPSALFDWTGVERPNHPELWQCIGMIVGVYGVGYAIAARDPRRHWPIVLVGLLGKLLGPIGMAAALVQGRFPLAFAATCLTNDLLWWGPFGLILLDARRAAVRRGSDDGGTGA